MKHQIILIIGVLFVMSGCAVIKPGEVGVRQRLGQLSETVQTPGAVYFNPLVGRVIRLSTQTNNLELTLNLPSKEGLSIDSQISILYKLRPEQAPMIIKNLGTNFEPIIANVFRSSSADICAQYLAKDLHSGMRASIEEAIKDKMMSILGSQGIEIEAVLMKSIQLPARLSVSIEQKLQAEQDVMRMEFTLQQAKLEADRKIIEAQGTSDAQKIISEGLTDEIIKIRSIEAFMELSKSPNSKVIITNGNAPFLIDSNK